MVIALENSKKTYCLQIKVREVCTYNYQNWKEKS